MKELSIPEGSQDRNRSGHCRLCGAPGASMRLPFAVGRQDSPPFPREYRLLGLGPRRRKFLQRFRWVWHSLRLCRGCSQKPQTEKIWSAIQSHPQARLLIEKGYTETRLDPNFNGRDGETTSSEEPI